MAIVEMSKLKVVGLKRERNLIINTLTQSGLFEVKATQEIDKLSKEKDTSHLDKIVARRARISFAIDLLNKSAEEVENFNDTKHKIGDEPFDFTPIKKTSVRKVIGYDDFYDCAAKEYELLSVCDSLDKLSFENLEFKSQITKLESHNRSLMPFKDVPLKFSDFKDTKYSSVLLFNGNLNSDAFVKLNEKFEVYSEKYLYAGGMSASVICLKHNRDEIINLMNTFGFSLCNYTYDNTAAELIEINLQSQNDLKQKLDRNLYNRITFYKYLEELKILYDFMSVEIEKAEAELEFVKTQSAFVIEGWIPSDSYEHILDEIKSKTDKVVSYIYEVEEGDEPPTLIKSKKILQPYQDVTNMYSTPAYGELDPNPFMAVFFFLFFGIMMADAAYGLVLSIGAILLLKLKTFERGTARLIALIGMGGVSAIIWGILFGSYFSIEGVKPILFNPMEEPIYMLLLSIGIGIVQILVGYGLQAYRLIKKGKVWSALFDVGFLYLLFIGLGLFAAAMLLKPSTGVLKTVGLVLMIVALVGMVSTGGRNKKGVVGKIFGGFGGLYGLVNIFSDILSYARLFGLGLASGAIGLAFNTLGGLFFGSVPGIIIGVILLIPLHAFNLGIGILGAYVHNARLQFLEFYGKFYDGGGRLFRPMGENTKYIRCVNLKFSQDNKGLIKADRNKIVSQSKST